MKILSKISILSLIFLLGLGISSNAQNTSDRTGIILGVGPQANLPLGSLKDTYD